MWKFVLIIIACFILISTWLVYSEVYRKEAVDQDIVTFEVLQGESVSALSERLKEEGLIRKVKLFKKYLVWQKIDKKIKSGKFTVERPVTMARVAEALTKPPTFDERTITIIPGWTIRDIAHYFENQGIAQAEEVTELIGLPAVDYRNQKNLEFPTKDFLNLTVTGEKPKYLSYEGYIAPETYRVFADSTIYEILEKLIKFRDGQITSQMYTDIKKSERNIHEIITMASIVEQEARGKADKEKVADIFWRRYDAGWALQADSTVHYIVGKNGTVFTSAEDRDTNSSWNTYKFPGLPPGPICSPSLESILAVIYPEPNEYWYFLTTLDTGEVKYGKTVNEHNINVAKYLR